MRVAFVIPAITAGGAERVVVRLANYLSAEHSVFLFVERSADIGYGLLPSVVVKLLPSLSSEPMLAAIKTHAIDVVSDHFHWSYDHLQDLAKVARTGIPVVLSEHNSYFYPLFQAAREGLTSALTLYNERAKLYKQFNAVTALTRYSAHLLAAEGLDNIVLMYNPVSYETDALSSLTQARLLNVSSFIKPAKRLDRTFAAFRQLGARYPGAKLRIVGEIDYGKYLMHCRDSGVAPGAVEPVGICSDVAEHYLASSVYVMTSEIEGQPMVLLEAASHGLPQVVADFPGVEDQVLDGETGYVVEPDDSVAFAERVASLLRDRESARRMGRRARDFVLDRFNLTAIGERWTKLLSAVAETGAPPPELAWSRELAHAQSLRTNALPELNRWFQRVLRPKSQPIVSVIVPVYGSEAWLPRCLESLSAQSLKDIEIIVVNDASPGNAAEIVQLFARKDDRIVYCEHPVNRGLYQARSTGARQAQGAFLAHVDSDDFVHPDFLRRMHEAALISGADIVECAAVEVRLDGSRRKLLTPAKPELDRGELLDAFIEEQMQHVVWNKLYRRTLWDRAPLHMAESREFSITEDLLRNACLFSAAQKYRFVDHALYYYVRRPLSVVTEGDFAKMLLKLGDVGYVYEKVIALFASLGVPEPKLVKMREREITDFGWYLGNGFSAEASSRREQQAQAFAAFGIFGALAARQAQDLIELRKLEKQYWDMARAHGPGASEDPALKASKSEVAALQQRLAALAERLEASEKALTWERQRAAYFEGLVDQGRARLPLGEGL